MVVALGTNPGLALPGGISLDVDPSFGSIPNRALGQTSASSGLSLGGDIDTDIVIAI